MNENKEEQVSVYEKAKRMEEAVTKELREKGYSEKDIKEFLEAFGLI